MNRDHMLSMLEDPEPWDFLVVGGGCAGIGIALDAASRGFRTLLVEQHDFGKGTSTRSTKLVHGGVRYLQQGNLRLVKEALEERGYLRRNAPHLVTEQAFLIPAAARRHRAYYAVGLKAYDWLARRSGFPPSRRVSSDAMHKLVPTLRSEFLAGGVLYYDGQFDDARLLITMAQSAVEQGATLINYARLLRLEHSAEGKVCGGVIRDMEKDREYSVQARGVINATGAFSDAVRRMDEPDAEAVVAPSQGIHVVLGPQYLPGDTAVLVPRTKDGRVMFAIPWQGVTMLGTTDTPVEHADLEPRPLNDEVQFVLETAAEYLDFRPGDVSIRSVFAGIRPLVRSGTAKKTSRISRDHTILVSPSGLVTIVGGKWTTFRRMAEDCVNEAIKAADLEMRICLTRDLRLRGGDQCVDRSGPLSVYGTDAPSVRRWINEDEQRSRPVHSRLPYVVGQWVWAIREEMARTVEDLLARRTRCLILDAAAAVECAPLAAQLLAGELARDEAWQSEQIAQFQRLARQYQWPR